MSLPAKRPARTILKKFMQAISTAQSIATVTIITMSTTATTTIQEMRSDSDRFVL